MSLDELRQAVAELTWTFAKTMPQWPHWYVVRSVENEAVYVALFQACHQYGYEARFKRARHMYLELGDGFKYWPMTNNVRISKIINRDQVLRPEGVEAPDFATLVGNPPPP